MDASFIPIEVVPSKTPFGLDQLRRSYKTSLSAADAIAACPAVGTADETFQFMFLMPVNTPESAESATRVDLVYQGCLQELDGLPVLPDRKHDDDDSVQSASSSRSSSFVILTSSLTAQFYAPASVLTWFTYLTKGTKGTAAEPDRNVEIITVTMGDTSYSFEGVTLEELVQIFFSQQVTSAFNSEEIVPGKYWRNTERRTLALVPFIFDRAAGFYPLLYSAGTGYAAGQSIGITSGGACTMDITSVYADGAIAALTITSNALSVATDIPIFCSGGTGANASFTVYEVA